MDLTEAEDIKQGWQEYTQKNYTKKIIMWGTHVNPWLIHVNVWQKPLQYCNQPPTNKNKWKKKEKNTYIYKKNKATIVKKKKKNHHDPDNRDGVITHLEPDILECEVEWAFGSITMNKASGGDGIPAELFHILKDVLH